MLVVRIIDAGEVEFKAFETLARATPFLNRAKLEVFEGAYESVALFVVPDADVPGAIAMVQGGADGIDLRDLEESDAVHMDRIVKNLLPQVEFKL